MSYNLVIENATVVNSDGVVTGKYIGIKNGKISKISDQLLDGKEVIDATWMLVFPGFIDLHVHCRESLEGKWNYKEDFNTAAEAAINGGVTGVHAKSNDLDPPKDYGSFKAKKELLDLKKPRILITLEGAIGPNSTKEDIKGLEEAGTYSYKIFTGPSVGNLSMENWKQIYKVMDILAEVTTKPVNFHCEDMDILGMHAKNGSHIARRPPMSEYIAVRKVADYVKSIHKDTGKKLRTNFNHMSCYKSLEILKDIFGADELKKGDWITCEVTPHHLYFNQKDLNGENEKWLQMNPPVRTETDNKFLLKAINEGYIHYLATDHAPHTKDEKMRGSSGVPNLDTYGCIVGWLMQRGVKPEKIAEICSENPAKFLGLKETGRVEEGYRANLTIIKTEEIEITNDMIKSRCGWSPYEGKIFPAYAVHTIVEGKDLKGL